MVPSSGVADGHTETFVENIADKGKFHGEPVAPVVVFDLHGRKRIVVQGLPLNIGNGSLLTRRK